MKNLLRILSVATLVFAGQAQVARADDAAAATEFKSTPITVKAEDVHPRDLLAEISKTIGVSVEAWPEGFWNQNHGPNGPPTSITIDVEDKSFWTVIDAICSQTNLYPANMGNQGNAITLQWRGNGQAEGVFGKRPTSPGENGTVVAMSMQRSHTMDLNSKTAAASRRCGLSLDVYIDPRLRATSYDRNVSVETATDETGNSIQEQQPKNPARVVRGFRGGGDSMNTMYCAWKADGLFIPLDYDPAKSHKLASIKGFVRVQATGAVEKIEITDLSTAQGFDKSLAGRHVTIHEFKLSEKQASLKMTIERVDVTDAEWSQMFQSVIKNLRLETEDGKRFSFGGGGGGSGKKTNYELSVGWGDEATKPTKLVWEIPTKFHDVDLPFEFKDITLP